MKYQRKKEEEEKEVREVEELGRFKGMEVRGSFKKMVFILNVIDFQIFDEMIGIVCGFKNFLI